MFLSICKALKSRKFIRILSAHGNIENTCHSISIYFRLKGYTTLVTLKNRILFLFLKYSLYIRKWYAISYKSILKIKGQFSNYTVKPRLSQHPSIATWLSRNSTIFFPLLLVETEVTWFLRIDGNTLQNVLLLQ